MGCCEARNAQEQTLNLQMKKMFSLNNVNNLASTKDKYEVKTLNAHPEVYKNNKKVSLIIYFSRIT